jgi:hypothetical protein
MRSVLAIPFAAAVLLGCATTKSEVDAATDRWRQRITAEIPTGTEASAVKQWFENQGLQPYRPVLAKATEANDMEVWLESVPAREWFCDKWMLKVLIKVSLEEKVAQYDFQALGACL